MEMLDAVKDFIENTPQEEKDRIWNEVKSMNIKGPTVEEYFDFLSEYHNDPSLKLPA